MNTLAKYQAPSVTEGYNFKEVFDNWIRFSNSDSAKENYSRVTIEFFKLMFDKEISEITIEDIDNINPIKVNTDYVTTLRENNSNSTIRQKLNIVSSFMKELKSSKIHIDLAYLEKSLSVKRIKDDAKLIQFMTVNDYNNLKDWLENERFVSERYKHLGKKYSMLVEFMWSTGSRIEAVFNTKWTDIKYDEDLVGQFGYSIYIKDKGSKLNWKPVSEDFYNRLHETMYDGDENQMIFHDLSQTKFAIYMKEFFGDRKITPHSIKKGAVSYFYYTTNDIVAAQVFGDHESIVTTRRYIETPQDRMKQGSSIMTDTQANIESLRGLTADQLLSILEDRKDLLFGFYYESKSKGYI